MSNGTSSTSIEERVQEISHKNLPICTKIMKHGWIHGLTVPYLIGMSQHFYIPLQTSILAASNGTSPMSIGHRVQEIWLHKVTHAHQNHKTWLTSWLITPNLMGCHPIMWGFLTWCISDLDSTLRSWATGHQFQRLQAGPSFYSALTWQQ